jgi:hypothetical protein
VAPAGVSGGSIYLDNTRKDAIGIARYLVGAIGGVHALVEFVFALFRVLVAPFRMDPA